MKNQFKKEKSNLKQDLELSDKAKGEIGLSYCSDYAGVQVCPADYGVHSAGMFPFEVALIGIIIVSIVTVFAIKRRVKVTKEPLAKVEI